jgi:hypothetical protein
MAVARVIECDKANILGVYGHLFSNTDERAAQIIEAAFGKTLTEREQS